MAEKEEGERTGKMWFKNGTTESKEQITGIRPEDAYRGMKLAHKMTVPPKPMKGLASRQVTSRELPPAEPVSKPLEATSAKQVLPTREYATRKYATRKYADKLIAEVNEAIDKNIGTTDPIEVSLINYNEAVANEVIKSLRDAGWDISGVYGGGFDRIAIITLS